MKVVAYSCDIQDTLNYEKRTIYYPFTEDTRKRQYGFLAKSTNSPAISIDHYLGIL